MWKLKPREKIVNSAARSQLRASGAPDPGSGSFRVPEDPTLPLCCTPCQSQPQPRLEVGEVGQCPRSTSGSLAY